MRTDEWIGLIDHLTTRPEMWVGRADYEHIAAFINGYDHACYGALLAGFHEWLTMRYGRGHNLAWSALIRFETIGYPDNQDTPAARADELLLSTLRVWEPFRYREW